MGVPANRFVYFVKPINHMGPIKIGSSTDVVARFARHCSSSPLPLEILVQIPGSWALERTLHEVFSYAHSHLEWFHPVDALLRGVHALRAGASVDVAFDLTKKTGSIYRTPQRLARFTPQYRERLSFNQRFARRAHALFRAGVADWKPSELAAGLMAPSLSQVPLTPAEISALNEEIARVEAMAPVD